VAALTDDRWSIKRETTYGTADLTSMRWYPWLGDAPEGAYDNRRRTGKGMQGGGGRRAVLGNRSFLPNPALGGADVELKTVTELETKGLGALLDIVFGVSTVTAITGGSQQLFHPGLSTSYLPSATIQVVGVRNDGVEYVQTYAGCTAKKVTIEQPFQDIPIIEVEWDCRTLTTATGAASPVLYPANPTLLDSDQGVVTLGGAVTVPTTTALGSVATAFGELRSWKLEIEHNIDDPDTTRVIGSRNRPIAHSPMYSFEGEAEFTTATIADLVVSGAKFGWQQTWTTPEVLGAGFSQAQILVPQLALTGDLPKFAAGERRTIDMKAEAFNDGTNRDVYFVYRTLDVAL
jgi:hypothetical protein